MVQVCFYTDEKLGEVSFVSFSCLQVKQVNGKRVFKLTGYVEMAPRYGINELKNVAGVWEKSVRFIPCVLNLSWRLLLEELFYRIESVPSWNPTLVECKTIQPIDEHTDISYQVMMNIIMRLMMNMMLAEQWTMHCTGTLYRVTGWPLRLILLIIGR